MIPESEDNRLDQSLRNKFEDFELPPGAPVWAGIEQRLTPAPRLRPRRRPLLVPVLLVLLAGLSGLAGWLLPHPTNRVETVATARRYPVEKPEAAHLNSGLPKSNSILAKSNSDLPNRNSNLPKSNSILAKSNSDLANRNSGLAKTNSILTKTNSNVANQRSILPNRGSRESSPSLNVLPLGSGVATAATRPASEANEARPKLAAATQATSLHQLPADSATALATAADAETTPATLRSLAAFEHQTLEQLPSLATLAAGPLQAADRGRLVRTLHMERAELLRLQRRTDSLLLALGDVLPAAPAVAARPDSARPAAKNQPPAARKWSLLLTAAPEQNTLALQTTDNNALNTLRQGHEMGRTGFSATLLAEYRAAPRLNVGGGVGFTTFGADLRITNKTTQVSVRYDTTITHLVNTFTSTHQTYSIRLVQVPQLSPVFNSNGQVIRYDTVYVPRRDTVFTTAVQHDTIRTNRTTITPLISRKDVFNSRLLQPQYRFFTVPVQLRYRLTAPGLSRLWTDVSLGAQLQFFLGGTQVVTDDGENFRTETVRAGAGPFRRLNVALSGALALNYALTPRLSVSVAPSLRWQALSLYRPETGLRQQATATGLMFGVRFGL